MRMRATAVSAGLLMVAMWPAVASAQNVNTVDCDGRTLTGMYADVILKGDCVLDGATVFGSVLNNDGGRLTTLNGARILGNIQVKGGGHNVTLTGTTVFGAVSLESSGDLKINSRTTVPGVTVKDSGSVTVTDGASTDGLKVENSGDVTVKGSVGSIFSSGSGDVMVTGGRVFPGGVTVSQGGSVTISAGSEIGINGDDGSGGISVVESGGLTVNASEIEGAVVVEKGTGHVTLTDVTMASSDLIVVEQAGSISVSGNTQLSDVKLEKSTGGISLDGITTDSDTTIVDNSAVTIRSSILGGDVGITSNGAVRLTGNDFSLEDVFVSGNSGPVSVHGNSNFSIGLIENDAVTFGGNSFTDAEISKNTHGVSLTNNTGDVLKCFDNKPAPTGSGNNISELADGQCAQF